MDNLTQFPKKENNIEANDVLGDEYEDYEQEDENDNEERENFLPSSLQALRVKLFVLAVFIGALSVGGAVMLWNYKMLYFLLFSAYFAFTGEILRRDYLAGKIHEKVLICTGVRKSAVGNSVIVNFKNADESDDMLFYQFQLPNKKAFDQFVPSATYIVYYNISSPSHIISSVPV